MPCRLKGVSHGQEEKARRAVPLQVADPLIEAQFTARIWASGLSGVDTVVRSRLAPNGELLGHHLKLFGDEMLHRMGRRSAVSA